MIWHNIDFTPLVNALLALMIAVVTGATAVITFKVKDYLGSKTKTEEKKQDTEEQKQIEKQIMIAMKAAESLYTEPQSGYKKLAFVVDYLNDNNVIVKPDILNALVKANCAEMFPNHSEISIKVGE